MSPEVRDGWMKEEPGIPRGLAERLTALLQETTTTAEVEGYVVVFLRRVGDQWTPGLLGLVQHEGKWREMKPKQMLMLLRGIVEQSP